MLQNPSEGGEVMDCVFSQCLSLRRLGHPLTAVSRPRHKAALGHGVGEEVSSAWAFHYTCLHFLVSVMVLLVPSL